MKSTLPYFCTLIHNDGTAAAEIVVHTRIDDWQVGNIITEQFQNDVRKVLDWYHEVLNDQMLSYLDDAEVSVATLGLRVKSTSSEEHLVQAIHVGPDGAISFKIGDKKNI